MEGVMRKCAEFAQVKARVGRDGAWASLLSARKAIHTFLFENGEPCLLWHTDDEFKNAVEARLGIDDTFKGASPFITACYSGAPELRLAWGFLAEWQARQVSCINDVAFVNEYEGRCFPTTMNKALNHFQWAGEFAELQRAFDTAKSIYPELRWENPMMHPRSTFVDVRRLPVWTKSDHESLAHVMEILERNQPVFKRELQALKTAGLFSPAYNSLVGEGRWDKVSLYSASGSSEGWNPEFCALAPQTCEMFRNQLPGMRNRLPVVASNQEEVVFFYGSPNSHVLPHNGGCNGRINVHIGLEGFDGSIMRVWKDVNSFEDLHWSESTAIAYNDGSQHEVINGPHHRYVLGVGIMHPDIEEAHFAEAFNRKTKSSIIPAKSFEGFKQAYADKYSKPYVPPPRLAPSQAEKTSGSFGTWRFKLSGSKYTRDWGITVIYGYVEETFNITEDGACLWGDRRQLHLTGSRSGHVQSLSCNNQAINIDSSSFEPWANISSSRWSGDRIEDTHHKDRPEL